jgi:molecular chaperone DnaK
MSGDNRTLGRFQLTGIPPAPRGTPQIEVAFDIDANGILSVSAKDLGTGKEQSIKITSSSGLSDDEVDKMTSEAKEHEGEDKKKRELIDAKNMADQLIYATEKTIKEHGDKVSADEKKEITDALEKLKSVKDADNIDDIKAAMDAVQQASQKLGEKLYQNASQQQAGPGQPPPTEEPPKKDDKKSGGDDIIDADYEVKE